jgi:CubicO group peptidase (beta-lactamase class C family)
MVRTAMLCCNLVTLIATSVGAQTVQSRRESFEHSLSTGSQISGSAPQRMNILDRMMFHHIPGASVALIRSGKVEWVGAYGVRQTGGLPVTTGTVFDVASISKPVTAVGVLRLAQEGKIDLDRDVNTYLKRWKVPSNQWTVQTAVTARMLLNHTGGFGDSPSQIYKPSTIPTLLQLLNGESPATNFPVQAKMRPGSTFDYSNNGYLVLELLVEDVTGKPFEEAMRVLVLSPLGMTQSTFEQPLSEQRAQDAASAFGPRQKVGMDPRQFVVPNLAAGGLWSTAADLAKLAIEVQSAYAGKPSKVLNRKMARMMLTPGAGFPLEGQGTLYRGTEHWGLGIELAGKPSHPFFDHAGAAIYDSYKFMYLNGDGLIVTTNEVFGFRLTHELLRSAGRVYGWPDFAIEEHPVYPMTKAEMNGFVGDYGAGIHVIRTDAKLVLKFDQEEQSVPMVAWSATRFIVPGLACELDFHLDPTSKLPVSLDVESMQAVFNVKKSS